MKEITRSAIASPNQDKRVEDRSEAGSEHLGLEEITKGLKKPYKRALQSRNNYKNARTLVDAHEVVKSNSTCANYHIVS